MREVPVISIVDDDASSRKGLRRLVRALGYVAHTFASAESFLTSRIIETTACLIADVQMPQMSGLELQDLLRSHKRRMPIIFVTAFPQDSIRTRALQAGAVCLLAKPVDGSTLARHIHSALGMSSNNMKK